MYRPCANSIRKAFWAAIRDGGMEFYEPAGGNADGGESDSVSGGSGGGSESGPHKVPRFASFLLYSTLVGHILSQSPDCANHYAAAQPDYLPILPMRELELVVKNYWRENSRLSYSIDADSTGVKIIMPEKAGELYWREKVGEALNLTSQSSTATATTVTGVRKSTSIFDSPAVALSGLPVHFTVGDSESPQRQPLPGLIDSHSQILPNLMRSIRSAVAFLRHMHSKDTSDGFFQ